jgi:hypothetical protein
MRLVAPLALLLLASIVAFGLWAPATFAARDQAHADLLARERDLQRLEADLGRPDPELRDALLAEHAALVASVARQSQALAGNGSHPPRLSGLLRESPCAALRPGGSLHAAVLAQAGLADAPDPPGHPATPAEMALARVVEALAAASGTVTLDTLELRGGGQLLALGDAPGFRRIEMQVVLSGALPDLLDTLERLTPAAGAGVPQLALQNLTLRRIEPTRWGENLHLLETPPVRASATVDALFPPEVGP